MVIVLIGESGSGKTTVKNILADRYGYKPVTGYTTRPMRYDETDGDPYYFYTPGIFHQNEDKMVLPIDYRGWFYGTPKAPFEDKNRNYVAVLSPAELRYMVSKNLYRDNFFSVYLDVDRKSRLIKLLERDGNTEQGIEEAYRRNLTEVGQYERIGDIVNLILYNDQYKYAPDWMAHRIDAEFKKLLKI